MINEKPSKIDALTLKLLKKLVYVNINKEMYHAYRDAVVILRNDIMFDKKKLEDFKNEYCKYGKFCGWE